MEIGPRMQGTFAVLLSSLRRRTQFYESGREDNCFLVSRAWDNCKLSRPSVLTELKTVIPRNKDFTVAELGL